MGMVTAVTHIIVAKTTLFMRTAAGAVLTAVGKGMTILAGVVVAGQLGVVAMAQLFIASATTVVV